MSPSQWKTEGCPIANDLTAEIWLRLPNETAKAYQAFRAYQELPASDRSIVAAYDKIILHELEHYNGSIGDPDSPAVELQLWNDCIKSGN
jgi:hypothetical protein